jgi:hypothetical protein
MTRAQGVRMLLSEPILSNGQRPFQRRDGFTRLANLKQERAEGMQRLRDLKMVIAQQRLFVIQRGEEAPPSFFVRNCLPSFRSDYGARA